MKREEIKAIFPDATEEQLDKVLGLNGTDIEKQKNRITAIEREFDDKKTAFGILPRYMLHIKVDKAKRIAKYIFKRFKSYLARTAVNRQLFFDCILTTQIAQK